MTEDTDERFVANRDEDTFGGDVVTVASPATLLVLGYLVLTILVGGVLGAFLYQNPTLFGDGENARIAGLVVLGLTGIGAVRLLIRYIVLYRTKYVVTTDSVRRQYHLAYREESRELPLHMIRGVELSKSRLQALLGFATISFLSVGNNRGIGYVEFDNAAEPERLQQAVLELLETQREQATEESSDGATDATPSQRRGRHRDAPRNSQQSTEPAATRPNDATAPPANADGPDDHGRPADGNTESRRPVSGNENSPETAEPDARD
ncbi:PH domain-containing protein [Halorubellus sp. PRR65]|uniref:PH domain-containing protein n=1 Tax=Halorubellus sp. PRR65 TaxID=3098148 RepID=UPI002B25A978|nr:PH domain-containing protein [Halorubellus sp. PRR65]